MVKLRLARGRRVLGDEGAYSIGQFNDNYPSRSDGRSIDRSMNGYGMGAGYVVEGCSVL